MTSVRDRFWAKVDKSGECWLWTAAVNRAGYGKFSVSIGKHNLAHRVAWKLKHGFIPDGVFVLHKCDTPACVRPSHLFLGSANDNVQDMMRKGRHKPSGVFGEIHPKATLSSIQVTEIRMKYAAGEASRQMLAKEYGRSWDIISNIVRGFTWAKQDKALLRITCSLAAKDRNDWAVHYHGMDHPNATITPNMASKIQRLYATRKYSQNQLAARFKVSQVSISAVVRRLGRFK